MNQACHSDPVVGVKSHQRAIMVSQTERRQTAGAVCLPWSGSPMFLDGEAENHNLLRWATKDRVPSRILYDKAKFEAKSLLLLPMPGITSQSYWEKIVAQSVSNQPLVDHREKANFVLRQVSCKTSLPTGRTKSIPCPSQNSFVSTLAFELKASKYDLF